MPARGSRGGKRAAITSAALAVIALAGCGRPVTPGASSTGPRSGSPTAAATASATSPASPSSAPSATGAAAACTRAQLAVSVTRTSAAAGTVGGYLAFSNTSATVCTLSGWPDLAASGTGVPSMTAKHVTSTMIGPSAGSAAVVTLAPGEQADAAFTGGDNPGPRQSQCPPPFRWFTVTAPHTSMSVKVPAWISYAASYMPSCSPLSVSMVVPEADAHS